MSDRKEKDAKASSESRPDAPTAGDASAPGGNKRSGRVAYDARGNPIWEWQLETGIYSRDVSTQKLKKLDLGDLSIAETATHKQPPGLGEQKNKEKPPMPGGGRNPYDSAPEAPAAGGGGFNPYDNARSLGSKFQPQKPVANTPRKPTDLHKLDAWMKLKKNLKDT
jgi:hypothetical protein